MQKYVKFDWSRYKTSQATGHYKQLISEKSN